MKKLLTFLSILVLGQIQAQDQFTVYFDFDLDEANETSNKKISKNSDIPNGWRLGRVV